MILDASVIVSLLADEPGAAVVEALLDGGDDFAMSDWNRAEALDFFLRKGTTIETFDGLVDRQSIDFLPIDRNLASCTAEIRSVAYHRDLCPVSLADCVAVALAARRGEVLASSDTGQTHAAVLFGVDTWTFPNSTGVTPKGESAAYSRWLDETSRRARALDVMSRYR